MGAPPGAPGGDAAAAPFAGLRSEMQKEIAADVAYVRKAGSYLINVALQMFVQDLCALEVSPIDGQALTDALHAHGINVRYLGKVANLTRTMPHFWDRCTTEFVFRSTKLLLKVTQLTFLGTNVKLATIPSRRMVGSVIYLALRAVEYHLHALCTTQYMATNRHLIFGVRGVC